MNLESMSLDQVIARGSVTDTSPLRARLDGGSQAAIRVRKLSPARTVLVGPEARPLIARDSMPISFELAGLVVGPVLAQPLTVPAEDRMDEVSVGFPDLSPARGRGMLELMGQVEELSRERQGEVPVVRERLKNPARIDSACRALLGNAATGTARDAFGHVAEVEGVAWADGDALPMRWRIKGTRLQGPITIVVRGPWSLYRLEIETHDTQKAQLATARPTDMSRLRVRRWRRAAAPDGAQLTFRHPRWSDIEVHAHLLDVSAEGLAIEVDPFDNLLYPGLSLQNLELHGVGLEGIRFDAEVRHADLTRNGMATPVGMHLQPGQQSEARWLRRVVERRLYPNTRMGATYSGHLWTLYDKSGYFRLSGKRPAHFAMLKRDFASATAKLQANPEVGCLATWPSDRGVEAAFTLLKLHTHAWFGMHLSRRKDPRPGDALPKIESGRTAMRELNLRCYEQAQRDPSLRWVMAYIQRKAGWPRHGHVAFVERWPNREQVNMVRFRAMQASVHKAVHPLPGGFQVEEASPQEVLDLCEALGNSYTTPYVEALDLVPERMHLTELKAGWAKAGLMRGRSVFVAKRDGQVMAAGVFETAEKGLHLYGLLDCVRLYPLAKGGLAAFPALLETARDWFGELGLEKFMFLQEHGTVADVARSGLTDLGEADQIITDTRVLPDFLEHVWEVTTPQVH